MKKKIGFAIILVLITSIFFEIILNNVISYVPDWLPYVKFTILMAAGIMCIFIKDFKQFWKFTIILAAITVVQVATAFITKTSFWNSIFDHNTFAGNFGGAILLKFISILPIVGVLLFTMKSTREFYLCKGDLSIKAERISWLGINKDSISWGKLSLISGMLISFGTILLTIITVTGISAPKGLDKLLNYLPLIMIFAFVNSFCEGVLFRSAVLGTLKDVLPKKYLLLIAAVFFGIGHYYGVPSGIIGAVMSSILGWYMCRSMYETKGFVSSWIIHFMQDAVIFSSICLLGSFR